MSMVEFQNGISLLVHVPLIYETLTVVMENEEVSVHDVQRKVEVLLKPSASLFPFGEFSLFETMDKCILNSSPPIATTRLLKELEEVSGQLVFQWI